MIVCTHSHADHSPGARPLQALCKKSRPSSACRRRRPPAPASEFTPDRALADGEVLTVSGNGSTHGLKVLHTPGHAANHLCLVLEEDGLLFSGDHVLNGSTTVVDPPDGNMNGLPRLARPPRRRSATSKATSEFILPAHGYVLGKARAAIAYLKAHRLKREAKIAAAMQRLPQGTPEDWLPLAYDDVPERMWPVAARSLAAHVERIRQMAAP
jgi:recombination protein RecT